MSNNQNKPINGVIMHNFHWYLPSDGSFWNRVSEEAENLKKAGFTSVWLPPAYKGIAGINDVGYGLYDLYDLGEFDQKGNIRTKYGTKDEYINAIKSLKANGINVYADIAFEHMLGADGTERVEVIVESDSTRSGWESKTIDAYTNFTFQGRISKNKSENGETDLSKCYSDFTWNHKHFNGVDYGEGIPFDENNKVLYLFKNKGWDNEVAYENKNLDYLMGANVDFNDEEVKNQLEKWGKWYTETANLDGFRIDAVKHFCFNYMEEWVDYLRSEIKDEKGEKKELFTVGEFYSNNINDLTDYINNTEGRISLFDFPLHNKFVQASDKGNRNINMADILKDTLMERNPMKAVPFVQNHDLQPGRVDEYVGDWFKPIAYSLILLRQEGYPCVFYADYYGADYIAKDNSYRVEKRKDVLDKMLEVRRDKAYGKQNDYFDHKDVIGWTREGYSDNEGLAVVISRGQEGWKDMYIGTKFKGQKFIDALGWRQDEVTIDDNGWGHFTVYGESVAVWVKK